MNTFQIRNNPSNSGQVAIVILLIMVVLLTVGLSLASRTTQEVFLSQQEAESARVFNAAEVGVEDALSQDFDSITSTVTLNPTTVSDVSTTTTIQPTDTLETQVVEGAAVHLDLNGVPVGSNVTVQWSRENGCVASILMSTYYYDTLGDTKVIHDAFGPAGCRTDDFAEITSFLSSGYYYTNNITLQAGWTPLFARIRPVYADTALRVSGVSFPTQFYVIRSEADNTLGEENRTVEVGRTLSAAPSFMDYALYSGADITIESTP